MLICISVVDAVSDYLYLDHYLISEIEIANLSI